ncbi:MAG: hypothetical protein JNM96_09510 [Bacteroidia bacterium]|nr:hypothetical protein [Bacteroidia bacterium]
MRTLFTHLLLVLALGAFNDLAAQTKPAPKKTTTAKKPAPKKAAPKPINYYICTSAKDKFYHKRSTCKELSKCSETIKNIKSSGELKKFKKKGSCKRCFNM